MLLKTIYYIYLIFILSILSFATDTYSFDIIDKKGDIIYYINKANEVYFSSDEIIIIDYHDGFELIDTNFKAKLKSNRDIRQFAKIRDNRLAYWDNNKKKYGYLDSKGKAVISAEFDYAEDFANGFAIVGFGDTSEPPPHVFKKKIIDIYGNFILTKNVSPSYLSTKVLGKGIGTTYKGTVIIEYKNGNWISNQKIGTFENLHETGEYLIYRMDDKFGFMTWDGVRLTGNIYNGIYPNYSSLFSVYTENKKNTNYFIVNAYGEKIQTVDNTLSIFSNGKYAVYIKNKKVGVYDLVQNKTTIKPQFESIIYSEDIFVVEQNGKFGYLALDGKYISKVKYDRCQLFNNGIGIAQKKITE